MNQFAFNLMLPSAGLSQNNISLSLRSNLQENELISKPQKNNNKIK